MAISDQLSAVSQKSEILIADAWCDQAMRGHSNSR